MNVNDEDKKNVVFYGRVSTEHDAQLSALENQMQWYDEQLERHSNWILIDKYIDKGITGTQATKRPAFMQMIEDAKNGKFDLIVTREVCRFARNTVDTLKYTRQLRKYGVEVYFVEDNIRTFASDGELRLSLMATLAQEESRKDSERVKAGLKTCKEKGVLFGNGNILGYDLKRGAKSIDNTYVINEEQAETVRMIYDLYLSGLGYTKICKELCRLKRKDAYGNVSWVASKIGRILHNKTYAGYKCYNKSYTADFLDHSRVQNNDVKKHTYIKGDWPPIVDEDTWLKVQVLIEEKSTKIIANDKTVRTIGKEKSKDVWVRKLKCSCGKTFRKNKWRTNKLTNEIVYGYQCYNQVNNGSIKNRTRYGLDTEGYCDIPMIGEWKLHFIAKTILESIWTDRSEAVKIALNIIKDNYTEDVVDKADKQEIARINNLISKYESRLKQLVEMRMDNEITKEEYSSLKQQTENEILSYKEKLSSMETENVVEDINVRIVDIENTLKQIIDFSGPFVDNEIIERLVYQIIPNKKDRMTWILNLADDTINIEANVLGRKNNPMFKGYEKDSLPIFQGSSSSIKQ